MSPGQNGSPGEKSKVTRGKTCPAQELTGIPVISICINQLFTVTQRFYDFTACSPGEHHKVTQFSPSQNTDWAGTEMNKPKKKKRKKKRRSFRPASLLNSLFTLVRTKAFKRNFKSHLPNLSNPNLASNRARFLFLLLPIHSHPNQDRKIVAQEIREVPCTCVTCFPEQIRINRPSSVSHKHPPPQCVTRPHLCEQEHQQHTFRPFFTVQDTTTSEFNTPNEREHSRLTSTSTCCTRPTVFQDLTKQDSSTSEFNTSNTREHSHLTSPLTPCPRDTVFQDLTNSHQSTAPNPREYSRLTSPSTPYSRGTIFQDFTNSLQSTTRNILPLQNYNTQEHNMTTSYPPSVHRQAFSTLNQDIMNSYAYATRMRPRQIGNNVSVIQQTIRDLHPLSQTAHLSHSAHTNPGFAPSTFLRISLVRAKSHPTKKVFTHRCQQPDFASSQIRSVVLTYTPRLHMCNITPFVVSTRAVHNDTSNSDRYHKTSTRHPSSAFHVRANIFLVSPNICLYSSHVDYAFHCLASTDL